VLAASPMTVESSSTRSLKESLEAPERQIILNVLEANQWNRQATAETLGINRTTFYKKMKRLGWKTCRWRCRDRDEDLKS